MRSCPWQTVCRTNEQIPVQPSQTLARRRASASWIVATTLKKVSPAFPMLSTMAPNWLSRSLFHMLPWPPEASRQACFQRALEILHLVAGVSYYKAGLSPRIECLKGRSLDGLAEFLTGLYVRGLAEFGYVNQVDVAAKVHFSAEPRPAGVPGAISTPLDPAGARVGRDGRWQG